MVLMVFLLRFSKLVLPSLHPALVNYFDFVFLFRPSLLMETCAHSAYAEERVSLSILQLSSISLTSVLSKVFESILNRKFWKHLNTSNLISDRQYGFRKKHSTVDLSSPSL